MTILKRAETPLFSICVILLAGALSCCHLAPFQVKNGSLFSVSRRNTWLGHTSC